MRPDGSGDLRAARQRGYRPHLWRRRTRPGQGPWGLHAFPADRFGASSLVVANFGNTQLALGAEFWLPRLGRCDVFQGNAREIAHFFAAGGRPRLSPGEVLRILSRQPFSTVITMGRLGAILLDRTDRRCLLHRPAWDIEVLDPTGAGDAFAAGMVASLGGRQAYTTAGIRRAVGEGAVWSACACLHAGGGGECPDAAGLARFRRQLRGSSVPQVRAVSNEVAAAMLAEAMGSTPARQSMPVGKRERVR